jgi:hypothetical protein
MGKSSKGHLSEKLNKNPILARESVNIAKTDKNS